MSEPRLPQAVEIFVSFAALLRRNGFAIAPEQTIAFLAAIELLGPNSLDDIRRGWPTLPDGQPEFLPPALGLERLGAMAFDKGCYPGQEIAARLHYRGGHKWHLCRLRGSVPLPVGEVRDVPGSTVARVLDIVSAEDGFEALAVLQIGTPSEIRLLGNIYAIESTFDA